MRNIKILLGSAVLFFSICGSAEELVGIDYVNALLLLSDNHVDLKNGVKSVHRTSANNPLIYDLVAKRLSQQAETSPYDVDTKSWFLKALGSSGSRRYLSLMKRTLGDSPSKKLVKYYNASVDLLTQESKSPFDESEIDVEQIRSMLEKTRLSTPKGRSYRKLANLGYCVPVGMIFELFGYPDQMGFGTTTKRVNTPLLVPNVQVKTKKFVFVYEKFAELMMLQDKERGWCYLKSLPVISPSGFKSDDAPHSDSVSSIRGDLWSWEYLSLHGAAHEIMRNHRYDQFALDEVMLRVWWGRTERDVMTANGIRYLIKAIRVSKDPRYVDAMKMVLRDASNEGIRAQAKKYVKKYNKEGKQFSPESVLNYM